MKTSVRTKLLAASIIGCLIVPPSMAFAGPEEAAQYYDQASKAYEEGDYAEAADLLERAYAEDPNLIYQYNRILALQAMGKIDQALKVLDIYENPMKEDGRFDDIKEIRAQLEKAQAEAQTEKDTGDGDQSAVAAGDDTGDVQVGDGTGVVEPEPDEPAPVDPVDPADKGPNILGWSLVGAGVAGIGVGTLFGAQVFIGDVADRREALDGGATFGEVYGGFDDPNAQFQDDQDTWSTHRTLNWVFLGVGAASLIGGGAVLLMDSSTEAEADAPLSADNAELRLTPYVGADAAGGVLHITF